MKRNIFNIMVSMLAVGSLLLTSCQNDETSTIHNNPAVDLTSLDTKLPSVASGAQPGEEIVLAGVNLDNVGKVMIGEFDAPITKQTIKKLIFTVPAGDFPQNMKDNETTATTMTVYAKGNDTKAICTADFWVHVPLTDTYVTDHSPKDGVTIGDEVTIKGQNLDKINSISIGTFTINKSDFASQSETELKIIVPAVAFAAGMSELPLKAVWGEENTELVINSVFIVITPAPVTPPAQGSKPAVIGDEITFTGSYMNMYEEVMVGAVKAPILEQTESKLTIKIANGEYQGAKAANVMQLNIVGYYGNPKQANTLFANFNLDITPPSAAAPTITELTVEDGGAANDKFYLKKEVTIKGEHLNEIETITVGGLEATIKADRTEVALTFIMPEDFTFGTATQCEFIATYAGGLTVVIPTATSQKVYPFYYWKNITISTGSNTTKSYDHGTANLNAFFFPETGEVIATDDLLPSRDPYLDAITSSGSSNNKINKAIVTSENAYKAIKPYIYATTNSSNKLAFVGPGSGSSGSIKTHFKADESPLPASGTPLVAYRVVSYSGEPSNNDVLYTDSLRNGTLSNLVDCPLAPNGSSPYLAAISNTSATFNQTGIVAFSWIGYAKGQVSGSGVGDMYKVGFMVIKNVTNFDFNESTNAGGTVPEGNRNQQLTFDCYWPKSFMK